MLAPIPPVPGAVIYVHAPERHCPYKPGPTPRLCIVTGVQPNPNPHLPPIILVCPGTPIFVQDRTRTAGYKEGDADFFISDKDSIRSAGLAADYNGRDLVYRFDAGSVIRMPWSQAFKRLDRGETVLGSLLKKERLRIGRLLSRPVPQKTTPVRKSMGLDLEV